MVKAQQLQPGYVLAIRGHVGVGVLCDWWISLKQCLLQTQVAPSWPLGSGTSYVISRRAVNVTDK